MAAVADRDHIEETISLTLAERAKMEAALGEMAGIEIVPSQANFFLAKPEKDSKHVEEELQKVGIIVRELSGFYMPGHIRISVGRPEENQALIEKLPKIL